MAWWKGMRLARARKRRKPKGWTQAQLAKKVGVHKITISRLERGDRQPSMALLQRLARALGVDPKDLL
jgi:transcriptional regulator with XRE-family HTH domain